MLKEMTEYFAGEKQESLLFIAVGLIAIGVAVWFWANGHRLRFMAAPLVVIALMQLVVGTTVYLRTDTENHHAAGQRNRHPARPAGRSPERSEKLLHPGHEFRSPTRQVARRTGGA